MARLSGITDEPERAPSASAATPPPPTPRGGRRTRVPRRGRRAVREVPRAGERVHGRGVMRDPEASRRAGLRKFTKRDCAVCHYVKARTWPCTASPPRRGQGVEIWPIPCPRKRPRPGPARRRPRRRRPEVRGLLRLRVLPPGPGHGLPAELWRMSPTRRPTPCFRRPAPPSWRRRRVWRIRRTRRVPEVPRPGGEPGRRCRRPTTSWRAWLRVLPRAGSEYMARRSCATRSARPGRAAAGHRKTCLGCHSSTHEKPFDFARASSIIAHPTRPEAAVAGWERTPSPAPPPPTWRPSTAWRPPRARRRSSRSSASSTRTRQPGLPPDGREVWAACEPRAA